MARLLGARAEASPAQAQASRLAAQLAAAMTATLPPAVVAAGVAAAAAKQQGRGGKAGGNGSGGGGGGGGRAVPAGPPLESVLTSDVFIAELRSPSTRDALAQARRGQHKSFPLHPLTLLSSTDSFCRKRNEARTTSRRCPTQPCSSRRRARHLFFLGPNVVLFSSEPTFF